VWCNWLIDVVLLHTRLPDKYVQVSVRNSTFRKLKRPKKEKDQHCCRLNSEVSQHLNPSTITASPLCCMGKFRGLLEIEVWIHIRGHFLISCSMNDLFDFTVDEVVEGVNVLFH
jgi:hypothetical protein